MSDDRFSIALIEAAADAMAPVSRTQSIDFPISNRKITRRQLAVLHFIAEWSDRAGIPPTLREIGLAMGIKSTNGVNDHLKALERKGFLVRLGMVSRGLKLTAIGLNLVGRDMIRYVDQVTVIEREDFRLELKITPRIGEFIDALIQTGMFGHSRSECAGILLNEKLREVMAQVSR